MIDFLLGAILGAVATLAFLHFKGNDPAKIPDLFIKLEQRIIAAMSQLVQDAFAAYQTAAAAHEAKAVAEAVAAKEAELQPQIDAAVASDAQADAAVIDAATSALTSG